MENTMSVTALKHRKDDPDPLRVSLAQAIASAAALKRERDAAIAAVERGVQLVAEAEATLAKCNAAVSKAKERDATSVAQAATSSAAMPASTTRKARESEAEATDSLDARRGALQALQATAADLEDVNRRAELRVQAAINQLIAGPARKMVEELEQIKEQIAARQAALFFISNRSSVPHGAYREEIKELAEPFADFEQRLTEAVELMPIFDHILAGEHATTAAWEAACASLRHDSNAQLPES